MSMNGNIGCPITGCDTLIPVTIDLAVGGPDVLPRRQVPDGQPICPCGSDCTTTCGHCRHARPPGISVHPELSSDAVARVNEHLKLAHPDVRRRAIA